MSTDKTPLLPSQAPKKPYILVIHGGAGTMSKAGSTKEQQMLYKAGLAKALHAGYDVLSQDGEAIDAVVAAVTVLEDNPLFNAGKGAVFNVAGKNELEASLMLSKPPASHPEIPSSRRGLGVTLLTRTKNPSHLVRALYLSPSLAPHAFLSGEIAEEIGVSLGEILVDPSYFYTDHRWREHRRGLGLPEDPPPDIPEPGPAFSGSLDQLPTGTVGAVALDIHGCIASLTSTGGRTNKLVGRIGDTPLMGAGFWAEEWNDDSGWVRRCWNKFRGYQNKRAVGVSGTGDGDYFIRQATASTIAHRVRFLKQSLAMASASAVKDLAKDGGIGGAIALDDRGNVAMPLNCPGMYRGIIREDGVSKTAIFDDDVLEES